MIACPHCDAELELDGFDVGDRVECSDCEQISELASKTRLVGIMEESDEPDPYTPPKGTTSRRSAERPERMSTPISVWAIAVLDFLVAAGLMLLAAGVLAVTDDGGESVPGVIVVFGLMAVIPFGLGVAMIKGMKPAWYTHVVLVVLSVLGNLGGEQASVLGLALNAIWLVLLFLPVTREFFNSGGRPARQPRSRRREPRERSTRRKAR